MEKDLSELNLLSIFYFAMAGLTALTGSIPIVHVLLGLKMVSDPSFLGGGGPPPPFNPGWLFVGVGALVIVISWTMAFLLLLSGLSLRAQRRYWMCFIVACVICLNVPLGTALGIFTLLVLNRPSVKEIFGVGRVG
ncbi:MAG: hypothetical protein IT375_09005 [Polyangiaceae bacterium]|jgi:hypothetical protein|nr:hypothetical protein [Polyangiaceae bacterium]